MTACYLTEANGSGFLDFNNKQDDSELEYFPLSPTLTRIRIHKNAKPINQILCYPVTVHHQTPQMFSNFKRSAPSSVVVSQGSKPSPVPPNPPRRRSSRNSHTLRLISTMTIHSPSPKTSKRHEDCFKTTAEKSNVKVLRDQLASKFRSPISTRKEFKVTRTNTSSSIQLSDTKTNITKIKNPADTITKSDKSCAQYGKNTASSIARRCCRHCSFSVPPKRTDCKTMKDHVKNRAKSLERTFGSEKRKVDLILPKVPENQFKLINSPDLVSPTEVKKVIDKQKTARNFSESQYPPGTIVKKSSSLFASAKNGLKSLHKSNERTLSVTAAFSPQGREIIQSASLSPRPAQKIIRSRLTSPNVSRQSSPVSSRNISQYRTSSPSLSNISDRPKITQKSRTPSIDSLSTIKKKEANLKSSPTLSKGKTTPKNDSSSSNDEKKKIKKNKKDKICDDPKKDKKSKSKENKSKDSDKTKLKKSINKSIESDAKKKIKNDEKENKSETSEQPKQPETVQSDSFFQHLFLRDLSPTPSVASRSSYIVERSKIFENSDPAPYQEPSLGAIKLYLSNRKPVSESKFISLDQDVCSTPLFLRKAYRPKGSSEIIRRSSLQHEIPINISTSISQNEKETESNRASYNTSPIRSPSCRKIQSIKAGKDLSEHTLKKKSPRAKSAGDADLNKKDQMSTDEFNSLCHSYSLLSSIPDDYPLQNNYSRYLSHKSNRFKELNHFYLSLERLSELEKSTSTTNLKPRMKNEEEIIDYDRWKQVRTLERAKQEFDALYKKLFQDQMEKDLLFQPKTVDAFRWKHERERGLRIKEKSVENIKEQFEKLNEETQELDISKKIALDYEKEIYKPLWRGDSVVDLATRMVEKRSASESRAVTTSARLMQSENLLKKEIGSRLWSSLSMEQVNKLKSQLAEIYSEVPPKREDYSINVIQEIKRKPPPTLVIRRNSDNELSTLHEPKKKIETTKASSIASMTSQSLSESEKKKISLSLSQEVRDKLKEKYKTTASIILGKETRGAIAVASAKLNASNAKPQNMSDKQEKTNCVKNIQQAKEFPSVLAENEPVTQQEHAVPINRTAELDKITSNEIAVKNKSSTSETESASSDTSIKTAIFLGDKGGGDGIHKKIEYFEHSKESEIYVPTIYKPADDIDETDSVSTKSPKQQEENCMQQNKLVSSQSYADLKELFGERELLEFATLPLSATRKYTSATIHKPNLRATSISPVRMTSDDSSCENIYRSRSLSPEEKQWMSYLAYIKSGDVKRLAKKFETLEDFYSNRSVSYRRCKSDSEISRSLSKTIHGYELGNVYSLRNKYENANRGRSRTRRRGNISPIPKTPLNVDNRFMPHINIISKLASLYPKKNSLKKYVSVEELAKSIGCPVGEVEKLREKFDSTERGISLLGHMFTSSPNVHELRDIAPYLAGPWVAHQYPRTQDNTKPLEKNGSNIGLVKKYRPKPKSASPVPSKQPSSILKMNQKSDCYTNQIFDPSIHRPTYRYEPARPLADRGRHRSWSPSAKHTVTFKGGKSYSL